MTKKKEMDVLIEGLDYPDRAYGCELESQEDDEVDRLLELDKDYLSRPHGQAIKAKGGLPGQVYRAIPKGRRSGVKKVRYLELLQPSSLELAEGCSVSDRCGGCSYQTLLYETELLLKGGQIHKLFKEAGLSPLPAIRRSPLAQAYRNKMEYSFGDPYKGGPLTLGLHQPGHFYDIVPTPDCNIVPPDFNRIRAGVEEFCRDRDLTFYRNQSREGYLRHCVVRASFSKKELMVNLVTSSQPGLDEEGMEDFVSMLQGLDLDFSLVSVYHTTNDQVGDAVKADQLDLVWGKEDLTEEIFGLEFHIGPFSFFQPNVEGAKLVYSQALEYAGAIQGKTIYDLYCGTGTLTQIMASRAKFVTGIEIVDEAVAKAKQAALVNGLYNVDFIAGDVLKELDRLADNGLGDRPDLVTIDPPRQGVQAKAIEKIIQARPEKIIYISCNPRTQVQDILLFQKGGYRMEKAQAFDQFPRTKHLETVVLLARKN